MGLAIVLPAPRARGRFVGRRRTTAIPRRARPHMPGGARVPRAADPVGWRPGSAIGRTGHVRVRAGRRDHVPHANDSPSVPGRGRRWFLYSARENPMRTRVFPVLTVAAISAALVAAQERPGQPDRQPDRGSDKGGDRGGQPGMAVSLDGNWTVVS